MANTFDLIGSPLGLLSLQSRPTRDGMSSFNGGGSRNINVIAYNTGKKQVAKVKKSDGTDVSSPVSLFSGGSLPNFWPNIKTIGTDIDPTGASSKYKGLIRSDLHNNDVYDTSLLNIIEKLSFSKMAALRPQDFAYLKNLGVIPNNRLIIARRFLSPVRDNILGTKGMAPKSILITWRPEGEDFLDIKFGEEWTDVDSADFTSVLNKIGEEFNIGGAGGGIGKALNVVPLPGVTENLQRQVLESLGILSKGQSDVALPSGNPNMIKQAKRRKTIGYGQAGSTLICKVSIKMVVEYEQKFISGIDPTIAWMDILNNIFSFGTSNSSNYGLSKAFTEKLNKWTTDPGTLVDDFIDAVVAGFESVKAEINNAIAGITDSIEKMNAKAPTDAQASAEKKRIETETLRGNIDALTNSLLDMGKSAVRKSIQKYKIEIMGIANVLSGAPSTPWHVTVGNPLRPVFCSGDMIADDYELKFGPTLAFNDLPSNMSVSFTLNNARSWGLQEVLSKFNTGNLRTVSILNDYLEVRSPGTSYSDRTNTEVNKEVTVVAAQSVSSDKVSNPVVLNTQTKENGK